MDDAKAAERREQMKVVMRELLPTFSALDPYVAGGVVGQLVAYYIAGHNPLIRDEVRASFLVMVDRLIADLDEHPDSPWSPGGTMQ